MTHGNNQKVVEMFVLSLMWSIIMQGPSIRLHAAVQIMMNSSHVTNSSVAQLECPVPLILNRVSEPAPCFSHAHNLFP
jgi:hypothetical protein